MKDHPTKQQSCNPRQSYAGNTYFWNRFGSPDVFLDAGYTQNILKAKGWGDAWKSSLMFSGYEVRIGQALRYAPAGFVDT